MADAKGWWEGHDPAKFCPKGHDPDEFRARVRKLQSHGSPMPTAIRSARCEVLHRTPAENLIWRIEQRGESRLLAKSAAEWEALRRALAQ